MASLTDLDQWVTHINEDLGLWLFRQVNERLKRIGFIHINQQRLENGSIVEYDLGSPAFPKQRLADLLKTPLCTPFVGWSLLIEYLMQTGRRVKEGGFPLNRGAFVSRGGPEIDYTPEKENVFGEVWEYTGRRSYQLAVRDCPQEAWSYMEEDSERTVEKNPKCSDLLGQLSRGWEQSLYDRTLLARLSFVPWSAMNWGLKRMKAWQEKRAIHAPHRRRYLNPRTDLKGDPLVSDELKNLPQEEQRRIIARSFRPIPKQLEKRILNAIGLDKKAGPLKQGIWRLVLPPLVDYLIFLRGEPSGWVSQERAHKEASQILNARYPDHWPLSPSSTRRVKHSVTRG